MLHKIIFSHIKHLLQNGCPTQNLLFTGPYLCQCTPQVCCQCTNQHVVFTFLIFPHSYLPQLFTLISLVFPHLFSYQTLYNYCCITQNTTILSANLKQLIVLSPTLTPSFPLNTAHHDLYIKQGQCKETPMSHSSLYVKPFY